MLTFKIENPELENKFLEFAKKQHRAVEDIVQEAMKYFINMHKEDKLVYVKKDPMKHLRKNEYQDNGEDLNGIKPYGHIEDSAKYVHDLRRMKNN